jgi:hypothetical protein
MREVVFNNGCRIQLMITIPFTMSVMVKIIRWIAEHFIVMFFLHLKPKQTR